MSEPTAGERATNAERAWSLAKQRGDVALQRAALAEYREAWRELRRKSAEYESAVSLAVAVAADNVATELDGPKGPDALTDRERDIFEAMAEGVTYPECAHRLGVTEHTARNIASNAFHRLDVSGLIELYAVLGWLRVPR